MTASENQIITTQSHPNAFPSKLREMKTSLVQQKEVEKAKVMVRSQFFYTLHPIGFELTQFSEKRWMKLVLNVEMVK